MENVIKFPGRGPSPKNIVVIPMHRDGIFKYILADISTRSYRAEIWSRRVPDDAKKKAGYYTLLAPRVQDMIHAASREAVKSLFEGDPDGLAKRMVRHVEDEYKLELKRRRANVLYDKDGWCIYNPVPGIWMVTSPIGFLTATVATDRCHIILRWNNSTETYKYTGSLMMGLLHGIASLYSSKKIPYSRDAILEMLRDAGITENTGSVLTGAVHEKLRNIIGELTLAAHERGMDGIKAKLKELALDEGAIF